MKALVYHGPGRHSWQDHPDPQLQGADDAIVRVDAVTICGTDLHIWDRSYPTDLPIVRDTSSPGWWSASVRTPRPACARATR